MDNILNYLGIILTFGYLTFLLSVYIGICRLKPGINTGLPKVSIVVAARNEENFIESCLKSLLAQDYPNELIEIIIVNDRSEDSTPEIVGKYLDQNPNLKLINIKSVPENYSPKKFALTQGIKAAKGEIICATDADCTPPAGWVSTMVSFFDTKTGMVAGYSPIIAETGSEFFRNFLYIDALSLAIVAAGGIGIGGGWTCAGRNLAYRKKVFYEVGGFEDVSDQISGDDDLLMHMVLTKTDWKLRYAIGEHSSVPSTISHGKRLYARQRTRHASKFRIYPLRVRIAALTVFLFYSAVWLYPFYMIANMVFLPLYGIMIASKFVGEYSVVKRGAKTLRGEFDFNVFLKSFFLHPALIIIFSILGTRGKFTWKGREYHQK